jgi:hypothetical protein
VQLRPRSDADEPAVLAGRGGNDAACDDDRDIRDQQWARGVVRRGISTDGVSDLRHDAVPVAASSTVRGCTSSHGLAPVMRTRYLTGEYVIR